MIVEKIIRELQNTKGLGNVKLLNSKHKKMILELEDENNLGVKECVMRDFTIALTHDSTFREPVGEIVVDTETGLVLPAVPFPEAKGKDVVSSSPSEIVHKAIVTELELSLNPEEATLLIGFNL